MNDVQPVEHPSPESGDDLQAIARVSDAYQQMIGQVGRVIVGQTRVIEQLLIALFSGGHVLLVGVPGLAKTLLVRTVADTLSLRFSRIQFTPDLMPSDITGIEVIHEDRATGDRHLRFHRGPIFAHVILADEINRTPPKTQAALLEAMQERQVTVGGQKYPLDHPFFVLATQNPIEQEGTYPLPEALLDRFMFEVLIEYPSAAEELEIIKRTTAEATVQVRATLSAEKILEITRLVRRVPVADYVAQFALQLVRLTRSPLGGPVIPAASAASGSIDPFVRSYVMWGAGPRASQYLVLAAKARAVLQGRSHVDLQDIRAVAPPVLRHRIRTNYAAAAEGIRPDNVIDRLIDHLDEQEQQNNRGVIRSVFRSASAR